MNRNEPVTLVNLTPICIHCRRCKESLVIPTGERLSITLEVLRAIAEDHKLCKFKYLLKSTD